MQNKILLVFSIIGLILLYFAYNYLVKLESCLCAQGLATEDNKANISYLKYIELLLLVIGLLNLFFAFKKLLTPLLSTIYFVIIIVLYVIFVLNVYKLYKNMPSDCECALKWPRYYIYLQTIVFTFTLLIIFLSILLVIYNSQRMMKNRK